MVCIYDNNKVLAVNVTNDFTVMFDYYVDSNSIYPAYYRRFFLNVLIMEKYFFNYFMVSKKYFLLKNDTYGSYTFEAKISNTTTQLLRIFNVTKCEFKH